MKVIIQLQYSLTDSRVFHDVKNITQSSLHLTQPNPTHGWTQPMTNSAGTQCLRKKHLWVLHGVRFFVRQIRFLSAEKQHCESTKGVSLSIGSQNISGIDFMQMMNSNSRQASHFSQLSVRALMIFVVAKRLVGCCLLA